MSIDTRICETLKSAVNEIINDKKGSQTMKKTTKRLRGLEKKIANTMSVFNSTVKSLEDSTIEYSLLKEELEEQIDALHNIHDGIEVEISNNSKLLANFKKLLCQDNA